MDNDYFQKQVIQLLFPISNRLDSIADSTSQSKALLGLICFLLAIIAAALVAYVWRHW